MPKMPEGEKKEESAESLAEKKEQVKPCAELHIVLTICNNTQVKGKISWNQYLLGHRDNF